MLVISDTAAITSLLKIQQIHLLLALFGEVTIPRGVETELLRYHIDLPAFLQIKPVGNMEHLASVTQNIDVGEAEAIVLAKELNADVLLIDDKAGRKVAEREGIKCLGLVGVLLLAKQAGLITNLTAILERLEQIAGFYLAAKIKHDALRKAGET